MSLENVLTTVLSVPFLFGAATAIAFRKGMTALFGGVLGSATEATGGESPDE